MAEKNLNLCVLYDFYGNMLTDKQREVFEMYYSEDLSLAEIAEQEGISRQGVHDNISRTETILLEMEKATGCVARAKLLRAAMNEINDAAEQLLRSSDLTVQRNAQRILTAAASLKE